ncbi:MAG: hypothetical protein KDB22_12140 [Planctomycetales bacterium]|nr:hypothetical protein [Planctomycetales bacterium]
MNDVRNTDIPREQAVVFGKRQNLVGIRRTSPKNSKNEADDFAVILVTAGMLHSCGPYRLHVALARSLADAGIPSLRFDLSGIGESMPDDLPGTSLERAAREIGAAIDCLQVQGVRRVALFGLCSGADDAFYAALHDRRIVGLFALDGLGYRTQHYYWHRLTGHYGRKLFSLSKLRQVIRGQLEKPREQANSLEPGADIREFPSHAIAEKQLLQLEERGFYAHFHYTGGVSQYYNYDAQFSDMFPQLTAEFITSSYDATCDHTAFLCEHRDALVQRVTAYFVGLVKKLPHQSANPRLSIPLLPAIDGNFADHTIAVV